MSVYQKSSYTVRQYKSAHKERDNDDKMSPTNKRTSHPRKKKAAKHKPSPLAQLPVELLNQICTHLVYPLETNLVYEMPCPWQMMDLRLACQQINAKTFDFFSRVAFRTVRVQQTYNSLKKINKIAQHVHFASRIERLFLSLYEGKMSNEKYNKIQTQLSDESISGSKRRELTALVRHAHREQTDAAFMETSTADGIMLTMAMQKMPNLRTIMIISGDDREDEWPIRRAQSSTTPTTTHLFSTILSSLAFSEVKPHQLLVPHFGYGYQNQGVSLQALFMPRELLSCVSELRCLEITLETDDTSYKSMLPFHLYHSSNTGPDTPLIGFVDPDTWPFYASTFISHMPLLGKLNLGFMDKQWKDSIIIFGTIASKVVLPHLKDLTLDGLRCVGADLGLFFTNHNCLQNLTLRNLDITGATSFSDILSQLQQQQVKLINFECDQIAQNGLRTRFATFGYVTFDCEHHYRFKDDLEFFMDFTLVHISFYHAVAEQWEGVQRKLGQLSRDVIVTTRTYHADYPNLGYHWSLR
jgi:hypothetical protein